jgi:CYTH domain-containing protein
MDIISKYENKEERNKEENAKMEIERRFVIDPKFVKYNSELSVIKNEIEQFYILKGKDYELRARKMDDGYYLTYKNGNGLSRTESEIEISKDVYEKLKEKNYGGIIEKERYVIPYLGYNIELNIFHGNLEGLILTEVEFNSKDEAENFKVPGWFGREVTEDQRFEGRNLVDAKVQSEVMKEIPHK